MATNNDKKLKQRIISNLNLAAFTVLQQDRIISGLMDNAFSRISIAILDLLAEDEKKELGKTAKSKRKATVLKYLNSKIKNIPLLAKEISREVVEDFKELRRKRAADI